MFRMIVKPFDFVKTAYSIAIWAVFLFLSIATAHAASVTLGWNVVTNATGYKLSYGSASQTYTTTVDVVGATSRTITGLTEGSTYYFAVKAYNATAESAYSTELPYTVPYAAPVASISATPVSGTAPLAVTFTGSATGNVTTWAWNFGDGTPAGSGKTVSHSYSSAGTYTVTLTASNSNSSGSATTTITVTAPTVAAPVASFTVSPPSGTTATAFTFINNSTGSVTTWAWSLGDGSTSNAQSPGVKNYTKAGTYTVSLTATGPGGSSKAPDQQIVVTDAPPVADFSASATTGAAPLPVTFTDKSTGTITSRSWTFGDGGTSNAQSPSYTYTKAGAYTVTLKTTNSAGSSTKTGTITVSAATSTSGNSGPVAAYNFEEASGATMVDASGQSNHGTITGATRTTGKYGNALTFGNTTKYATVPNSNALSSSALDISGKGLTISFFAKITNTGSDQVLIDKPWNSTSYPYPYYQYGVEFTASRKTFTLYLGDTSGSSYTYDLSAPLGTWTHIAFTYDGANVKGYVDGVLKFTTPATFSIQAKGNPLRIGLDHTGGQPTIGSLDEIRIYNRALSLSEVQSAMNTSIATSLPPKGLLGNQTVGSADSMTKGIATAFKTTASVTGQVTSLPIYVDKSSASTTLIAGIYKDNNGHPGTLMPTSDGKGRAVGTLSSPKVGAWNQVPLPAIAVNAGTSYWIAVLGPNGTLILDKVGGSVARETSKTTTLATLPSTWTTGTVSSGSPLSGYGAGY